MRGGGTQPLREPVARCEQVVRSSVYGVDSSSSMSRCNLSTRLSAWLHGCPSAEASNGSAMAYLRQLKHSGTVWNQQTYRELDGWDGTHQLQRDEGT